MKYKVINNNDFSVGIRYENTGHEITIRPRTHVMMEEEDILYVNSVSKLFQKGIIYTESEEMLEQMGYLEKSPNTISVAEASEILKLANGKMKLELKKITEKHAIDKVLKAVKQADLSQSKLKIIQDVFDVDINDELDEELI